MFTIYGGKREFAQWDLDQFVICPCMQKGDKVYFYAHGKNRSTTAYERDGEIVADVPNALLQLPGSIRIDLGSGLECHIDCRTEITITAGEKPDGYCCTDNSNLTKKYIASTPQKLTEAEKAQVRENIGVGAGGGGGASVQSDWNQTDAAAADFIKNKPFGDMETLILEEQELQYSAEEEGCFGFTLAPIDEGSAVTVMYDGTRYDCTASSLAHIIVFGNLSFFEMGDDTGEPFVCMYAEGKVMVGAVDEDNHTVKITCKAPVKIANKYINAQTVFYQSEDDKTYLYVDQECTVKATNNDVKKRTRVWQHYFTLCSYGHYCAS